MKTDSDLERQLRSALHRELDHEVGPDPTWTDSPAAQRTAEEERGRRLRWPVRLLAIAALITIGAGSALLLSSPDEPTALGSNGWIAQGSGGDIYFLAPDQEVRRVIGASGDSVSDGCPAFSPDGQFLAFGRVTGEADLYSVTEGFQAARPDTYQHAALIIADVADDGVVSERLTIELGDGLPPPCPVWSPTGDRIAFGVPLTSPHNPATGAAGSEVWILTVADSSITVLPDLLATDLEFSPDGTLLGIASGTDALTYGNALADGRIHLYSVESGATRILESTLGALSLTWSPDGRRIAYGTGEGDPQLRLIDLDTEEQRVLDPRFEANHGIGPVWSPDGESILYQRLIAGTGERHDVVLVWPDDLSADGTPRKEIVPLFAQSADGSQQELYPYWVTWSPDGQFLLFSAWPAGGSSLLGVVPSVPGSPSDILVGDRYPFEDPEGSPNVYWEPGAPIQAWQRRPEGAVRPDDAVRPDVTPTPSATQETTAEPTPSPSTWTGLPAGPHPLVEGSDTGVPITVTIAASGWNGEPNGEVLCWRDPADICADPPDGAGLVAFEGREYYVYGEACRWSITRPDTPATTVDELIEALANQGSRAESTPEEITVDGHAGKRISLSVHPVNIDDCDEGRIVMFGLAGTDPARYTEDPDLIEEVWAVDVDGVIVVLDGTYHAETPQVAVDELRAILASASFE